MVYNKDINIFNRFYEDMSIFRRIKRRPLFRLSTLIWLVIILCLLPLNYAHAYIDPGTGSYAIQVIIGVIFGAGYAIKAFSGKIIKFINDRRSKKRLDV